MMNQIVNCMIAGVGGQGTVFASKLIAEAAISYGLSVRTTETIGMAQRGGSVVSHIRMGAQIHSPLIPLLAADIILAFEPAEGVRLLPYLTEKGIIIVCSSIIKPVTSSLNQDNYNAETMLSFLTQQTKQLIIIDTAPLLERCGSTKPLNVAILGAASKSGIFPFDELLLEQAIQAKTPERFLQMNLNAFQLGKELYALS